MTVTVVKHFFSSSPAPAPRPLDAPDSASPSDLTRARVAKLAAEVNEKVENIGARRLQTIMERLVEEISFTAEDAGGTTLDIDAAYVDSQLADVVGDTDLSKYVL